MNINGDLQFDLFPNANDSLENLRANLQTKIQQEQNRRKEEQRQIEEERQKQTEEEQNKKNNKKKKIKK